MKTQTIQRGACLTLSLFAAFTLAACSAKPQPSQPAGSSVSLSGASHLGGYWQPPEEAYTQEDLRLALSFQGKGYAQKSVEEFDRSVMNWEDEEAFHNMEATLLRLFATLPDSDPNAGFILGTLGNAWESCEAKHYKGCGRQSPLRHSSWALRESYGDVYGDRILLYSASAEFQFDYLIPDEKALTVTERDRLLSGIRDSLKNYLDACTREKLSDTEEMELSLKKELEKSLKALDGKIVWGKKSDLFYRWYAPYEFEAVRYESEADNPQKATDPDRKAVYDSVLEKLCFDRYQDMSVADFNRIVNAAFYEGTEETDRFSYDWEIVQSTLSLEDPTYDFFYHVVPASLEEYRARAQSVYSGKQIDPVFQSYLTAQKTEDVFGDSLPVGELAADISLHYRILDPAALTVKERTRFFEEVTDSARLSLEAAMKEGALTEEDILQALQTAGKNAGRGRIEVTDCKVLWFEYRQNY